jgi:O-methyltransferase
VHSRRLVREGLETWKKCRDLAPTLAKVQRLTMLQPDQLIHLAGLVDNVMAENVGGDLVECGVWRGGASFLMADRLRRASVRDRKVWLFDSFEGLPPAEQIDGPRAMEYGKHTENPWYLDNCRASLEEVQQSANELGLSSYTELVKGWFDQTLPAHRSRVGPIAILQLDCDWYSSVRCCLDNLYDQVAPGGYVVVDDYYTWDGCAVAVHQFLGDRGLSHPLWGAHNRVFFRKL